MTAMETIAIRGLRKPISRIGLGTWAIGGWMWGGSDEAEAIATIQGAVEHGITLVDTAAVYGFGRSETIVGKALKGIRNEVAIATKGGLQWLPDGRIVRNSSPGRLRQEVEDSLRRLDTDHIDLYQIHWPDPKVALEETARELERLRTAGKILAIGVSNFSVQQMQTFRAAVPLATVQPPYNLFEREIEHAVLPYAKSHALTVLAYGALCRGLLSGHMTAETSFHGDDLRRADPKFQQPRFGEYLAAAQALARYAQEHFGKSLLALAIRWILDRGPTIALWGARHPHQLAGLEDAFGWKLGPDDVTAIDGILKACIRHPIGPEFMAPPLR